MIDRATTLRIAKLASQVLAEHQVRDRIMVDGYTRVDPVAVAENEGVPVMTRPLDRLLGAFLREERPGILLNSLRPPGMVRMTCAHELGHFFLGHLSHADERLDYTTADGEEEVSADQFAYALMAPSWLLAHVIRAQHWSRRLNEPSVVYQLSLRLGLSYEGTVWSLQRQGKIPYEQARMLASYKPVAIKRELAPAGEDIDPHQDLWVLSPADRDTVLEPRSGDRFYMVLPDHTSAGFLWSKDEAASQGFTLRPVADSVKPPADLGQLVVGGMQHATYRIELESPAGQASLDILLKEDQPWNPAGAPTTRVNVTTEFDELEPGLTRGSRARLVKDFEPS